MTLRLSPPWNPVIASGATRAIPSSMPADEDPEDYENHALSALDAAEAFRKSGTGVDRPVSALTWGLAAVTYGLLEIATQIRALREEPWKQPRTTRRKS